MNKSILINSLVGISTQVKIKSIDLDALVGGLDDSRVNLFNIEEPLDGDIIGFNIELNDCPDGATGTVQQIGDSDNANQKTPEEIEAERLALEEAIRLAEEEEEALVRPAFTEAEILEMEEAAEEEALRLEA